MTSKDSPTRLRVEHLETPRGLEPKAVRFSWNAPPAVGTQTGYRVRVCIDGDGSEVWDSGSIESASSSDIPYAGPALEPRTTYAWTVRVRDETGTWSAWSAPSTFETGVAEWTGEWIAPSGPAYETAPAPAPAFRTTFEAAEGVEKARLYVAVGGTCDPRLNGERITDRALDPGTTDYEERILYAAYDVTDGIQAGENALAVVCGRERYAMTTKNPWGWCEAPWHRDHPELLAELTITYSDGTERTVATDSSWRVGPSATRYDSLYEGEVYDARAARTWSDPEFDDEALATAEDVSPPEGAITPQLVQPIAPVGTVSAEAIHEPRDDVYVVDFGEMIAGWVRLTVDAPAGTEIEIAHGEKRQEDGTVRLDLDHFGGTFQTDRYTCSGEGREQWEPRFSYKGFRYVQLEGLPSEPDEETVTAVVAHSTIERGWGSSFEASDDLLNAIHDSARRALLNNHHSLPTDTPAYEKHGWTGDAQVTAETALYNFDMHPLYRKWLRDVADAQLDTGELPPFVPTSDWGYRDDEHEASIRGPNPAWDCAYVLVPWWTYQFTGDTDLLAEHYDGMTALLRYLARHADEGIIDVGLGDWYPPGDGELRWHPPEGPAITSTAYYYRAAEIVSTVADRLGRDRDRDAYAALADRIRDAFNDAFFDRERSVYSTGEVDEYRQTSNLFPVALDIVPERNREAVVANLVDDIRNRKGEHLDTGIVGTKYILGVLCDHGYTDLAHRIATQRTYPSWGHWIEEGVTAMCEAWELEVRSHDHHMFGSVDEWFYKYLAGIRPATPGFETVAIEPFIPTDLESVAATVETPRGRIRSAWEQTGESRRFDVTVPPNARATARLPLEDPEITGDPVGGADAHAVDETGDRAVVELPAGSWSIRGE
ncbi:glycoside hydrolase family 78 protein [Halobacteria archaeon AArc-m2/3/4]|uniref:alpha-L-rhamnosidase n=1 Tax=Natronoglomus mannanivorans TaxID=2979990 RepID=A0ABT2QKT9_9EURY|nr:glycoside hydrolase family 78 protein [Halobacteria archaeon AArc-m2/3/4]